jgi:transposase
MKRLNKEQLPDNVETLKQLVLAQYDSLAKQQGRIQLLEEQIILFNHREFGKSSEKCSQQAELFDEAENEIDDDAPSMAEVVDADTKTKPATKAKSGRKPLPPSLPRVRIEHDLTAAEKICQCGCQKTCIGEDISEQLDIIPAVIQVLVHARKKYACKNCENGVDIAALPEQPIPKSNASPGLLAHIVVAKYQDALPLYRMETIFKRLDIHLPRNTQANWMIKGAQLFQPLYNLFNDQLLASGYIHVDETTVQVLKEPGKSAESKSYMWVRRTGDREHPIVLFDYHPRRSGEVVTLLLGDYQGYLQTDDYASYLKIGASKGVTHLGCMAHARRKFMDAKKVTPSKKGKVSKADVAVEMIKVLYRIETEIKDKTTAERYIIRQQKSIPQLGKIRTWLDKALESTLPKGKAGIAIAYMHRNWQKLIAYTKDGRLNIDNNPVENAIRPFAIGRKNWMFSDSQNGAKASAMYYSIIETAKANGIEPYVYLRALFTQLPSCKTVEDYESLLPWNIKLGADFKK